MTWSGLTFPLPGHLYWVLGLLLVSLAIRALPTLLERLAAAFEECPHCRQPIRKGQGTCHRCLRAVAPPAPALVRERRLRDPAGHR